ncbi:MAG: EF-hand domain-containing protein [Pseudomonadota bacterium]
MQIQASGRAVGAWQSMTQPNYSARSGFDVTQLIEKEDTDLDGKLSLEETSLSQDMFSSADADSDGLLSTDELEQMLAQMPPPPSMAGMNEGMLPPEKMGSTPPDFESILDAEDKNKDGLVSADESALQSDMFSSFDTDGDGMISAEEYNSKSPDQTIETSPEESLTQGADLFRTMVVNAYQQALQSFFSGQTSDNQIVQSLLQETIV